MKMYGKMMLPLAFLLLAGCQSASKSADQATAAVDPEMDQCGASQYQNLVGKPLSALDSMRFSTPVRAIPWNTAVTMDFNLKRLNFMGDSEGKISRAYCG